MTPPTASTEDRSADDSASPVLLATSPPGHGLLLTLVESSSPHRPTTTTHSLRLEFVPSQPHPHVHPHVRCPASVPPSTTLLLHGGGSGAAVFGGVDANLGPLVMKHGGHGELMEVVALATVHRQLTLRGRMSAEAKSAASDVGGRIPDFRSAYVDPEHLVDRGRNLWDLLRRALGRWGGRGFRDRASTIVDGDDSEEEEDGDGGNNDDGATDADGDGGVPYSRSGTDLSAASQYSGRSSLSDEKYANPHRSIRIFVGRAETVPSEGGEEGEESVTAGGSSVVLTRHSLDIYLDPSADVTCTAASDGEAAPFYSHDDCDFTTPTSSPATTTVVQLSGPPNASGYAALLRLSSDLAPVLRRHLWKATLAQSTIGSRDSPPPTASSLHLSGTLRRNDGRLLDVLIDQFICVVRELRCLTRPEEVGAVDAVRAEVADLDRRLADGERVSPDDVSHLADLFVGRAIHKNFGTNSRFEKLRAFGDSLTSGDMILTPEEVVPANVLVSLLRREDLIKVGDVFDLPPNIRSQRTGRPGASTHWADGVYDGSYDGIAWLRLLRHATSLRSKSCTDRIWNAGLADAGLHNQFLEGGGKILLFDLGKPSLEPVPAFLTKFFMSFFHTLGMEEEEGGGGWVRRFYVSEGGEGGGTPKVALTKETEELLPEVHKSFERTMDRFIHELFDGEVEVRGLIVKYVLYQLVSDAAFCVEKWDIKGGGKDRAGNHNTGLEKWLWRALWDIFVAWHVGSTVLTAEDWII